MLQTLHQIGASLLPFMRQMIVKYEGVDDLRGFFVSDLITIAFKCGYFEHIDKIKKLWWFDQTIRNKYQHYQVSHLVILM